MALKFSSLLSRVLTTALSITLLLVFSPTTQASPPQRIVSLSLCTDLLLLTLIEDKNRIASISYLAADTNFSFLANETTGLTLNHAQAEEILLFKPDLILTTQFSAGATVSLLERLGHPVSTLGFPATIDDAYIQIRLVAKLVEEVKRGETLIQQMQNDIQQALAQTPSSVQGKSAVFYSSNGFSYGGSTLRNDFLKQFGLNNLAADLGMFGPGQLSLEALLAAQADYLIVTTTKPYTQQLAHPMLQHPALKQVFSDDKIITLSDTLFQCAGPSLSEAFNLMAQTLSHSER